MTSLASDWLISSSFTFSTSTWPISIPKAPLDTSQSRLSSFRVGLVFCLANVNNLSGYVQPSAYAPNVGRHIVNWYLFIALHLLYLPNVGRHIFFFPFCFLSFSQLLLGRFQFRRHLRIHLCVLYHVMVFIWFFALYSAV